MPSRTLTEESRLLNRELSWIEFNARVLDLVADETVPLLERVKFCSIFSNNLDEFFQVRVAGLMGQAEAGFAVRSADGLSPADALEAIKKRVSELTRARRSCGSASSAPRSQPRGSRSSRSRSARPRSCNASRRGSPATSTPC